MKKTSFINETKSIFLESFNLIKDNPLIYGITLLISFETIIANFLNLPRFLSFLISVFLLGWIGAKVDLINQVYKKKEIKWDQLGHLIFKYLKKLLPFFITFTILIVILILVFALTYFRPIISGASSPEEGKLLITQKIIDFQKSGLSTEFSLTTFILSIATSLMGLTFVQGVIKMVIEDKGIFKSLKEAVPYVFKNIQFFLFMAIALTILSQILIMILGFSISFSIKTIIHRSIWTYISLISTTMILVNYSKNK